MATSLNWLFKGLRSNWKRIVLAAISMALFISIWYSVSWWLESRDPVQASLVPAPDEVADAFFWLLAHKDRATGIYLLEHMVTSLERVFLGFVLALALAVPAGLVMGRSWMAESLARPVVEIFRPIPPLAWAPAFLIIFSVFWGPVAVVFLGVFFPILYNVMLGARSVDRTLIDASRTLGARGAQIFTKVVLPYTIPYLMTGITVGLGIGWMCIVAAEFVAAEGGGLGYFILANSDFGYYKEMYAGMALIGLVSILTTGVAGLFERSVYKRMGMK